MAMHRHLSRRAFAGTLGAVSIAGWACPARAADAYTMRLGEPQPAISVLGQVGVHFATAVLHRTNGQVKIEVYPNGQLAGQQETIDDLQTGVVDFAVQAATFLQPLFPRLQVLELPFLFSNLVTGHRVLDGPIGQELFSELDSRGIMGLGATASFREVWTTSKPVVVPEDMKGLRIRIPGGTVAVTTYQALGAIPVTIDQAEIFTAAQQHTIDGIDTNIDSFTTEKYYTVVRKAAMVNHFFAVNMLLGSKRKINALPDGLRKIVLEEAKAAVPFWRGLITRQTAADLEILKTNGVAFTDPQPAAFRKVVEPVYGSIQSKVGGDLVERISRAAAS